MVETTREFQVFAKPAGALCNLDCRYCYYLKKEHLYPKGDSLRMPHDILEQYMVQHIEATPGPVINFSWHGGEPTILGLDYFRTIVELQRKHRPPGRRITNGIQTNGTLLDEAWCRFLAEEGFAVGLSLDGPEELHDAYRTTKGGRPTHGQVMRGYELIRRYGIPCDILCVVHAHNSSHPTEVYRFFKAIEARYVGFLPLVEQQPDTGSGVTRLSVPADAWGDFLCTVYDEWLREDVGQIKVQIFEEAAKAGLGEDHALCIFRETCGDVPVVEHNGDFFPCDHFVAPEYRLGDICQTPLAELIESPAQRAFGEAKADGLPRTCRACEVLAMCHGGCPKNRFIRAPDGEAGLNYLCSGYQRFFTHCRPFLEDLAAVRRRPTIRRVTTMQTTSRHTSRQAGRNDPCPCGSGRKYKKCCLGK